MFETFHIGNKKFFCFSYLQIGLKNKYKLLASFLAILLINVFIILECKKDFQSERQRDFAQYSLIVLELLSMYFFIENVLSDPGVIPIGYNEDNKGEESIKIVEFQNKCFALKYCATCKVFRPLRAHHCSICNVCIEELDHHCPWISNCVGKRNRKSFLVFLTLTSLLAIEVFALSIYKLTLAIGDTSRMIYLILFIGVTGFLTFSLTLMLFLQFYLIGVGLTTYEYLKDIYENIQNPFDKGCILNCCHFCNYDSEKKELGFKYLLEKDLHERKSRISKRISLQNSEQKLEIKVENEVNNSNASFVQLNESKETEIKTLE